MIKVEAAGNRPASVSSLPTHTHAETRMVGQPSLQTASPSIEAWCNGVQRLTEEYFFRLGDIVVAHPGLCAPSRQNQFSSGDSGAPEKLKMMCQLRSEHKENSELDVQATDIEAAEIALLQKLWAYHELQQKRQRPAVALDRTEKEDHPSRVSRSGSLTVDAVTEEGFTTADRESCRQPHPSSAATAAPEDGASSVPCGTDGDPLLKMQQHPSSESAACIPEELLELFRTAQALHSAASGSTRASPPATSSREAAAAGENPFDATPDPLSRKPVTLSDEENAQAAAMALLCFHYFYHPSSTPASPVEAAVPPVSVPMPPEKSPRTDHVQEKLVTTTEVPKPKQQHQLAPFSHATCMSPAPNACNGADASSHISPSSRMACRKHTTKSGSFNSSEHPQQPSSSPFPSSTPVYGTDGLKAELALLFPQQAQQLQGDVSCGLPPPRAFLTGSGASFDSDAAADKSRPESKSRNTHVAFINVDGTSGGARRAGVRPPFPNSTVRSPSTEDVHNSGASPSNGAVKLPLLHSHSPPTSAGERPPPSAASSSPPTSTMTTTIITTAAAALATPHVGGQCPALPTLSPGTTAVPNSVAVATTSSATAASTQKHGNGTRNATSRGRSGKRRRAPRLLHNSVVLPPNYSGVRGEKLTMTQLEQLVTSVSEDCALAQSDVKRQYDAAEAAAAKLYRLQQAVARVLLENIQLEKDICTLTATSHTCSAGDEDGDSDKPDKYSLHTGAMSRFSASAPSPVCTTRLFAEKRQRQLILPPAPMPLPHAKRALTASSLLLHAAGNKKAATVVAESWPSRQGSVAAEKSMLNPKGSCKRKARTTTYAIAAASEGVPEAVGPQDPRTILQELHSAIVSRETEKAQILAEIDALSSRVTRHDTLLHAVAEYWRRNAAVMKRQHFAVQSQPRQFMSENVTQPFDGDDGWGSENAVGASTPSCPFSASDREHGVVGQASSSSGHTDLSLMCSHSTAAMSLSEKMTNLDGTPSQVQRALAQMEALSPTPLSSALSFDLRMTSVPSALSPPLKMETFVRRQVTPLREGAQENETVMTKSDAIELTPNLTVEDESTPMRPQTGVHVTPVIEKERGGRLYRKVFGPPQEGLTAAAATAVLSSTLTDTSTTATTIFRSPNTASDTGGMSVSTSAALPVGEEAVVTQEGRRNDHGPGVSAAAVNLFNGSPHRLPGNPLEVPPDCTQAYKREAREDGGAVYVDDSSLATPLHPSCSTTANNSRTCAFAGMRRDDDDDDVLHHGSWRTIPALQLENVDEIAEFIYSVFERP
ncbi:hypothetical protein, conserved [Leishmania tarentolae]|uniref:Uncharacterized protein n=1 Tax=Leishmania tarentolae TaxID=5689 RepID=A0A640KDM0_LEITA|nr:hypothetical protein, conserved [Leishmania tarentolae]